MLKRYDPFAFNSNASVLIVTIALIVRPKRSRKAMYVGYTVLMIIMPIAALFNLLQYSTQLECTIVEFMFVLQLVAINLVELRKIKRRKIKWAIKIALYVCGFAAYAIYFAAAINDIMFFLFIMLTVVMLNITLIVELVIDGDSGDRADEDDVFANTDGDSGIDMDMPSIVTTLNHIGEAMIIVGAIIAFAYQFVGDVNNVIGAYIGRCDKWSTIRLSLSLATRRAVYRAEFLFS